MPPGLLPGLLPGVGVGWRPALAGLVAERAATGRLGFTEVVAENTAPDALPPALADLAARGTTVVPHGVTLGLAGADRPDPARLARLAALAHALDAPLVSEHVAFVRAGGAGPDALHADVLEAGHLVPPPRTREALDVLVAGVREAQAALPVPLALENVAATFAWPEDELDEPAYLTELVERTGCLLVLDVANLHASCTTRGEDPVAALARMPLDAVAYVHVAGGRWVTPTATGGTAATGAARRLYLDTHADPVPAEVLAVLTALVAACRARGARLPGVLLERDDDLDEAAVRADLEAVEHALATAGAPPP